MLDNKSTTRRILKKKILYQEIRDILYEELEQCDDAIHLNEGIGNLKTPPHIEKFSNNEEEKDDSNKMIIMNDFSVKKKETSFFLSKNIKTIQEFF